MDPLVVLGTCFMLGLLHGVLPDEHTWPITFSYAIGSASGKEGMKAGIFFSAAFAIQRALMGLLVYAALAPFLKWESFNSWVFVAVGLGMGIAGVVILLRNEEFHIHILGHHHDSVNEMERSFRLFGTRHQALGTLPKAPPVYWTFVHGFIAGFGFEGLAAYPIIDAAPKLGKINPWFSLLPGLAFGLGTMLVLVIVGALFGTFLRLVKSINEEQIKRIGIQTSGRTLFYGGLLFLLFGIGTFFGLEEILPVDAEHLLMGFFIFGIAVPAFIFAWRKVKTGPVGEGMNALSDEEDNTTTSL